MEDKEYKEWYESVDFIQDYMQFYSIEDFLKNSTIIKSMYLSMRRQTQKLYQWYIFSGRLNYKQKAAIWDYINDNISYPELIHQLRISNGELEQRNDDE